jgi:hypothetical protein
MVHYQARLPSLGAALQASGSLRELGRAPDRPGLGIVHMESRDDVSVGALVTASRPTEACVPAAWQDWPNE